MDFNINGYIDFAYQFNIIIKNKDYHNFDQLFLKFSDKYYINESLTLSIYNQMIDIIPIILILGADINTYNGFPLYLACELQNENIVQILLNNNADISYENYRTINVSIKNNNMNIITMLIDHLSTSLTIDKATLFLQYSFLHHNLSMANLWIDYGADINKAYNNYVVNANFIDNHIVQFIINNNVNPNDDKCCTLQYAVQCGDMNLIKLLFEYGANISDIAYGDFRNLIKTCQIEPIKFLLCQNFQIKEHELLIPLVARNNVEIIKLLMDYGLDIKIYGQQVLHMCFEFESIETLKFLLDNGLDIQLINQDKLEYITKSKIKIVELLETYGFECNIELHNKKFENFLENI